ncbi:MAG: retroviral-like aspartic protease family protein [Oscillospiraceae bacterium]|nr:retroviral-like aspartic protease family protein [Oscillospiraceae bacterium]
MNYIPLQKTGAAFIEVAIATINGDKMSYKSFLVDTGATVTTIPKSVLIEELGYTEGFIKKNKVTIPDNEKPLMANGQRADLYKIEATRMNIDGYELKVDSILTSDSIKNLALLLGLDILKNFTFAFNFDWVNEDTPYGRMLYELRKSVVKPFENLNKNFIFHLDDMESPEMLLPGKT